jgi:hypothetical protein
VAHLVPRKDWSACAHEKAESRKQKAEMGAQDYETTGPRTTGLADEEGQEKVERLKSKVGTIEKLESGKRQAEIGGWSFGGEGGADGGRAAARAV